MKQNKCDFWWASILALLSVLFSHSPKHGITRSAVLHGPVQYRVRFMLGGLFQDVPLTALVVFFYLYSCGSGGGSWLGHKIAHFIVDVQSSGIHSMTQKGFVSLHWKPALVRTNNNSLIDSFVNYFFDFIEKNLHIAHVCLQDVCKDHLIWKASAVYKHLTDIWKMSV